MDTKTSVRRPQLMWAALGLVVAIACGWAVEAASPAQFDPSILEVAAYVAIWIPLMIALGLSFAGRSVREAVALLGLQFRAIDLLWGIGIGCLGRAADALLRLVVMGSTGLVQQPTLSSIVSPDAQTVALGVVAPVLIAPVIEEIYFRGLIQRRLAAVLDRLGSAAKWTCAVVVTSVVFALVHALLLLSTPTEAALAGVSTLVFALLAGATAAATQRLGGAMVGHVVFNGLGVLLTWPV